MARCEVSISHPRIRKNCFVDAKDEADAIRQFHERFDLPKLPEGQPPWPIEINWLGAPTPEPTPAELTSLPKTAAEVIAAEVGPPAPGLDVLKSFGVTAPMMTALRAAGLETVAAILAHAKKHKGLVVPGIDVTAAQTIRNAIKAFQSNEA